MKKPFEMYAGAVCFVTIIWFAVSFTMLANDLVNLAFPRLMLADGYNALEQETIINDSIRNAQPKNNNDKLTVQERAAVQAKAAQDLENKKYALQARVKEKTIRDIIHETISLIISGLIFVIHWRLGRWRHAAA